MSWLLAKGAFGLMPIPNVVIIGRPNVGKSSLLNWIAGRRVAIVDDMSGVTRDRVGTLAQVGTEPDSRFFEIIDTGGIGMVDRDDLSEHVEKQIDSAIAEADLILFVVDIRDELMPLDEEVAARLRYVHTPVILVMNKADTPTKFDVRGQFYKLGAASDRRLHSTEPQQAGILEADRPDAPRGRYRQAGRGER